MIKFGLKLWSTNSLNIREAAGLWGKNIFQYIELFTVPISFGEYGRFWKELKEEYDIPFVMHAPHFTQGFNLARKEKKESNKRMLLDSLKFADALDSDIVIIHPGVNGSEEETIRQINGYGDSRLTIENKPLFGLANDRCNGFSPELIDGIISGTGCRFCLDFAHAIQAANALKADPFKMVDDFYKLNPVIYHLADGDFHSIYDDHLNLGKGSYPIIDLIRLLPDNSMVTNEANRGSRENLDDFLDDYNYLKINKII